jgi:hypothetical protein
VVKAIVDSGKKISGFYPFPGGDVKKQMSKIKMTTYPKAPSGNRSAMLSKGLDKFR